MLQAKPDRRGRVHIVQEFNKGVYDYIIATDEGNGSVEPESEAESQSSSNEEEENTDNCELIFIDRTLISHVVTVISTQRSEEDVQDPGPSSGKRKRAEPQKADGQGASSKKKSRVRSDKEYGVIRGVDFIDVACVLNFDLPTSSSAYTHRVGRTARAGRTGMALSFVVPRTEWGKNKVVGCLPSAKRDEARFARIESQQAARSSKIKEYNFDMKQVEAFRYRMQDALRSVTRSAIREARVKELKSEILNSEKLKVRVNIFPHYITS